MLDTGKSDGASVETILSVVETNEETKSEESDLSDDSTNLCLRTVDISDSQLKLLNIFRDYPVPEDPGLVPGFWILYPPPTNYKNDGIQKFKDLSRATGLIVPVDSIVEMIRTDTIDLRCYNVHPKIFRALCEAIRDNTTVQNLILKDNPLTPDSCCHLNKLLTSNKTLSHLDLSGCEIGVEGAKKLQDGISSAPCLIDLNLRRCHLGDDAMPHVSTAICYSNVLENVDLSDNRLGDESSNYLHSIFIQAEALTRLDLSWNNFYGREFSIIFFRGLSRNETIRYLDMSWNGLGRECSSSLCMYVANSQTLREFDLSDNRFTAVEGEQIAKALSRNVGLEVLRLKNNPLEPAGALALVKALLPEKSPDLGLRILDLGNVWANKDILPSLERLNDVRPSLNITLGGILGNYKIHGPDSREIFLKRANYEAASAKKKKDRKDFGHFVIGLNDETVSRAKFKNSVNEFKLKLTDSLVNEIMNCFGVSKNLVDQKELNEFYLKLYPDTHLPPAKTPKSPKKSKRAMEKKMGKSSPRP